MTMTDQEQKELRSYCAFLLKEYGFHFSPNDPVLPALYVIHKDMQLNNQNNKGIASLIQDTASRINPTVFNFNSEEAAWKFQLGITLRWSIIGSFVLLLVWAAVWYRSMANDVDQARRIVTVAEPIIELLARPKRDETGRLCIDFTENKGGPIQPFKEYLKIENSARVYLEKERTNSKKK